MQSCNLANMHTSPFNLLQWQNVWFRWCSIWYLGSLKVTIHKQKEFVLLESKDNAYWYQSDILLFRLTSSINWTQFPFDKFQHHKNVVLHNNSKNIVSIWGINSWDLYWCQKAKQKWSTIENHIRRRRCTSIWIPSLAVLNLSNETFYLKLKF